MPRFKHVSKLGRVQLTPEEEAERDAEEAQWKKQQEEYLKVKYKDDRKEAYPSIEDQLDKIYHSGIDGWKKDIKVVKDKFPKP